MEEYIKYIFIKLASSYGYGVACSIIFICLIIYLFLRHYGIKISDSLPSFIINSLNIQKSGSKKELNEHILFQNLTYWMKYRLNNIQTDCAIRERLFIDILTIRFKIMEEEYRKIVNEEQYLHINNKKFGLIVLSINELIYTRWYKECEDQGIPVFILNQFDHYLGKFVGMGRTAIISIFDANFVNTSNYSKLYITMNLVSSFEEWLFSELEKMLNSFNGEISGLTYKGITCKHCDVCVHNKAREENNPFDK